MEMASALINPEEEYEYQFYQFSSSSVLDGIKNILNEVFESILDSMSRKLISNYNYETDAVTKAKDSLLEVYRKSIKEHSEDLKEIVQLYFALPNDIVAPEDDIQKEQYTAEDEHECNSQFEKALKQISALTAMEKKLEEILQSIMHHKNVEDEMEQIQKRSQTLYDSIKDFNESPLLKINSMDSLLEHFAQKLSLKFQD